MTIPPVVAVDPLAALSPTARWLFERSKPDEPALELISPSSTLDTVYAAWLKAEEVESAIRLIAAVVPARESIWWAWVSARHATQMPGGIPATREVHAAITAVERWIVRPDDDARREAWDRGNDAGLDTPIGMVSAAVFLSGTSIAPPNVAPVPPPPGTAMPLVGGAIILAAASTEEAALVAPTLVAFAAQGIEIVKRLGGWEPALKGAYDTQQRLLQDYERATAAPPAR
jgi:hypothetical protein